jgi:hypothetical protein
LLAREKARAISRRHSGQFVVGADQTLALGTPLFSKPAGRVQAAGQLRALAGNSRRIIHHVSNYGEVCERNLGKGSKLAIPRGLNRLWTEGGLQYVPPMR